MHSVGATGQHDWNPKVRTKVAESPTAIPLNVRLSIKRIGLCNEHFGKDNLPASAKIYLKSIRASN
jgi:hypothetical protein